MAYRCDTIVLHRVPEINVEQNTAHPDDKSKVSPEDKVEEVPRVSFANTVICEYAMMVHILNTAVAPRTVTDSDMCSLQAALIASVLNMVYQFFSYFLD